MAPPPEALREAEIATAVAGAGWATRDEPHTSRHLLRLKILLDGTDSRKLPDGHETTSPASDN